MHVTCVAHLLRNCAMRVHAHFKNMMNNSNDQGSNNQKQRLQERFS